VGFDDPKILRWEWVVKEEFAFGNSLGFQAQLEDLRLKYCILKEKAKNSTSGRKIAWRPPKIFPTGTCSVQNFLDSCPKHRRVHFVTDETQIPYPATPKGNPSPRPTDFKR
jgi:hypothetical protein